MNNLPMNFFLDIPRDILFLLVQYLDIRTILTLNRTSKEIRDEVSECIREINFSPGDMWKRVDTESKETEKTHTGGSMSHKFHNYSTKYKKLIRLATPKRYSLLLPHISLLKRYPSLIKSSVPFLGSISDLLDVDPTSLHYQELSLICTCPEFPQRSFSWIYNCWTPLPHWESSHKIDKSPYERMKEWLVAFVLAFPNATLSMIIIPERHLIQTESNFGMYYNTFSYSNRHVKTTLPYGAKVVEEPDLTVMEPDLTIMDLVYPSVSPLNTDDIPVEKWLDMIDSLPTDNVNIEVSDATSYSRYDENNICSLLRDHFPRLPESFGYDFWMNYSVYPIGYRPRPYDYPLPWSWNDNIHIKQAVGRVYRSTSYGDLISKHPEDIPRDLGPLWNMEMFRYYANRYRKEIHRMIKTNQKRVRGERRLTLVPEN